jgi:Ca-activated chloride channel family protein
VELLRRSLIALVVPMLAASSVTAQTTFTSRIEAVRVDVLVTENGRPVEGLEPGDFEILDNGVRQKVDLASFEQIPLNVVLALDMSASLQGLRLGHLQTAGRTVLDALKKDDRAALVAFSHVVMPGTGLSENLDRARAALEQAQGAGLTSLIDASHAGMMIGESDVGRSLLILFSDGVDTSSWLSAESVLDIARRSDVVVYSVEIGEARAHFTRELSEVTGGRLLAIESTQDLSATFIRILEEFRMRYLISYSPQGVSGAGWHRLDVRVKGRSATVKARPGYFADGP